MKHLFSLLILSLFCFALQAQSVYDIRDAVDFINRNKVIQGDWKAQLGARDIEGSPYLNDEFVDGTIYTTQKLQYNNVPLRYNIFNDNLEFLTEDEQELALSAPEIVEKAEIGEHTMAYLPYYNSKKMKRGFFIVLEEGEASLYERLNLFYQEPTEAAAYKDPEPAKFLRRPDTYFIRIGKEAAVLVDNKKALLAAFPDHQDEIAAFIKKNKTKTSKPEKLQELVKYYNSL